MTAISYVTQQQMEDKTGFKHALGYSLPKEDKILLRKGLTKKKKKEVLAHEEEHIAKGEEGPWAQFIPAIIQGVSSLYSAQQGKKAGKKAGKGARRQEALIRDAMNMARADTRHTRQAGATALNALMSMTGLAGPGGGAQYDEAGWPVENVGGGFGEAPMPSSTTPSSTISPSTIPTAPRISGYGNVVPRYGGGPTYRYAGGETRPRNMYSINEFGPENNYQGGAVTRNPNPAVIDGQTGYVEPNRQSQSVGDHLSRGAGASLAMPFGPEWGALAWGGDEPRRGSLPGTDWQRDESGKIMATGYGHWNADLGQYVDRRGRPKQHQTAPPEGWADPSTQTDIDTTQGTDFNFQTDPGYQFRFEEGQRALDRGAAARGGLLSGGYGRKAIRYGQGFASNEYTNVYNRIANIAGMGQVANQFAGGYAMQGGMGMGTAAANRGIASAYGTQMGANAIAGGANQLAQMPWGNQQTGP